jgi:hypothetical protein
MRTTRTLSALLVALAILTAACSPAATTTAQPAATVGSAEQETSAATATFMPTETAPPPTGTPEQAGRSQDRGLCSNRYFPIEEGVTRRYRALSPVDEPVEYEITFSDVSAEGFTAHQTYPDLEVETEWTCSESGLVSVQFARVATDQIPGFEVESIDYEGVTLPPAEQWEVGLQWDSKYQMAGQMTLEGLGTVNANLDISSANEIVSVDAVSVPAGDYENAMRVDSSMQMVLTGRAGDISIPEVEFEFQNTNWYVRDVGLVKSEMVNEAGTFTTELLSIE